MPSFSKILGASALAGAAMALPVAESKLVTREAQPGDKLVIRVDLEYRQSKPRIAKRDELGNVVGYYDGGGWVLPVLIGGQQVALNIDTGSSDLWTASTLLSDQQKSLVQTKFQTSFYDPTKSGNYTEMTGSTYSLSYADNSHSSGKVGTDSVNIGGAIVPKMPFGVCDSLALGTGQTSRDTDGPVGLGFGVANSIRPNPQPTFMEALEPYVAEPVFSTKFRPDSTGSIMFGGHDTSLYTGQMTTISIKNETENLQSQWGTTSVSFGINGQKFSAPALDMDFDSGTASLSLSDAIAKEYFGQVQGATNNGGSWSYPCSSKLPNLDFMFSTSTAGPSTVTIPGKYIASPNNPSSGTCGTWIDVVDGRGNAGQPFYLSKYMIWNQKVPSLSFADQVGA